MAELRGEEGIHLTQADLSCKRRILFAIALDKLIHVRN